jgi:MYXO-CTERM domain-containing protein
MSTKFLKAHTKNRAALAFATISPMALGALTVTSAGLVNADTISGNGQAMLLAKGVTAGSFNLTKQAGNNMNFPIMFDRPSGVNAAAIAGTVTQLGAGSSLYKSALKAVPELSNTVKMNSLLSDALDPSSANYASARANIVKLINWYNSLGGQQIKTQSGAAYTTANLDQPINVLAVAFSNNNNINTSATKALASLNNAKTVGDVEKALDAYQSGVSTPYETAFSAYAAKVYANGADLNALSQYSAVKPVLNAYQNMYANGASAIRATLLNGSSSSDEAGVTFFESAVLAGSTTDSSGDGGSTNVPTEHVSYTTKWVDESGHPLAPPEHSTTGYASQKDIPNYKFETAKTDNSTHTKTYVYKPMPKTADTTWVDESGHTLKPKAEGTFPDNDGVSDIPGYVVVSTKTTKDSNGNSHTVNTYHKVASDTTWVDTNGKTLKAKADGLFPDNDGKSDIKGYDLVSVKTNTDANGDKHVINTYRKTAVQTHTTWVDTAGKTLKPEQPGNLPDTDHNDIPGYTWVSTTTDHDGNTINTYKKTALPNTYWFDTDGNSLKAEAVGQTLPDTDHNDIPGYTWQSTYTVTADDLKQGGTFYDSGFGKGDTINIYKKNADVKKIHTNWVDTNGNKLKEQEDGAHPDDDGTSDIPGYTLVQTKTDADGNVTNIYEKTPVPKTVHTNWVDTEGNKLKDQEEGSHPDDDGKSDIPGYTLLRTDIDDDGNVTNVYKADTKQVTTSWVDENGNKLTTDVTGDDFSDPKSFDGYTMSDIRMSPDGTHKYYVYTKDATPSSAASSVASSAASMASSMASEVSSAAVVPSSEAQPEQPEQPSSAKTLPQAGMDNQAADESTIAGMGILSALGLGGLAAKRRRRKSTTSD